MATIYPILLTPFGEQEAQAVLNQVREGQELQTFSELLWDDNVRISRNVAWVFTKTTPEEILLLLPYQNRLIDGAMQSENSSQRRLFLNLLERLPMLEEDLRTDFLDFCLERMQALEEYPGIQSVSMKLAYRMCSFYPELMEELHRTIQAMELDYYKPAVKCVARRILTNKLYK